MDTGKQTNEMAAVAPAPGCVRGEANRVAEKNKAQRVNAVPLATGATKKCLIKRHFLVECDAEAMNVSGSYAADSQCQIQQ